jgi:hypothetical protein
VSYALDLELFALSSFVPGRFMSNQRRRNDISDCLRQAIYTCATLYKPIVILWRADRSNPVDYPILAPLFEAYDLHLFFDEPSFEEIYFKFAHQMKINTDQKLVISEQICLFLSLKLHFASILVNSTASDKIILSSMLTDTLAESMTKACRDGLLLIVHDVTWLHPFIDELLSYNMNTSAPKDPNFPSMGSPLSFILTFV